MFKYLEWHPVSYVFCLEYADIGDNPGLFKDLQKVPYATSFAVNKDHYKLLSFEKYDVSAIDVLERTLDIMKDGDVKCIGFGKDALTIMCVWDSEIYVIPRKKISMEIWYGDMIHETDVKMIDGRPDCSEKEFWAHVKTFHRSRWYFLLKEYFSRDQAFSIARYIPA